MIKNLSIKNYKSIKELDLSTKRVNVFIGEHNSGKSNILEALTWFSFNAFHPVEFDKIFRFKTASDFFYDFDTTRPVEVKTDRLNLFLGRTNGASGNLKGIIYSADVAPAIALIDDIQNIGDKISDTKYLSFTLSSDGAVEITGGSLDDSSFRTYIFKRSKSFDSGFLDFLSPPFGENIPSLLVSNKSYRDLVGSIFKEKGFRLMLKPDERDISMAKDINDELYAYSYTSISETFQRIIFYTLAIESSKGATLVLDEPESNTFPMYTKQLAELIALDANSNQYFIATHNPYLLGSLVSKTPIDELAVFVVKMEDYVTKAFPVSEKGLSTLLDKGVDVYFNLNKLIDE